MKKTILFGTKNPTKIRMMRELLKTLPLEILNLRDLGIDRDVEESGTTPEENAVLKAQAYFEASGRSTFAIDGGIAIEKLSPNKQPGVFVRRNRVDGRALTDEEMLDHYTEELRKVGGESKAVWTAGIALIDSAGELHSGSFLRDTVLTSQRCESVLPGAPLNSIQIDSLTGKYLAEMTMGDLMKLHRRTHGIFEFMESYFAVI